MIDSRGCVDSSSILFNTYFETPEYPTIVVAEYFWNDDPGEGLGTPILAMDGDYNKPFENLKTH